MSELHYSMKEFLSKFNQNETEVSLDKFRLGMALIAEENRELKEILEKIELALWNEEYIPLVDKSNLLNEMGDVIYVVNWLATLCGVDIQEVYDRVHISNMSKLDDNGKLNCYKELMYRLATENITRDDIENTIRQIQTDSGKTINLIDQLHLIYTKDGKIDINPSLYNFFNGYLGERAREAFDTDKFKIAKSYAYKVQNLSIE